MIDERETVRSLLIDYFRPLAEYVPKDLKESLGDQALLTILDLLLPEHRLYLIARYCAKKNLKEISAIFGIYYQQQMVIIAEEAEYAFSAAVNKLRGNKIYEYEYFERAHPKITKGKSRLKIAKRFNGIGNSEKGLIEYLIVYFSTCRYPLSHKRMSILLPAASEKIGEIQAKFGAQPGDKCRATARKCRVDVCTELARAKGLCMTHRYRDRNGLSLTASYASLRKAISREKELCQAPVPGGCGRERVYQVPPYCKAHYSNHRRGRAVNLKIGYRKESRFCQKCDRYRRKDGLCLPHYYRKVGMVDPAKPVPKLERKKCKITDCIELAFCNGYCRPHNYKRTIIKKARKKQLIEAA